MTFCLPQSLIPNTALIFFSVLPLASESFAVSPEAIAEGRMLFEKNWTPRSPSLGSDGLGPMFNASSCAACHNQGGVGGGGDAQFNAKTIGIDRMQINGGPVDSEFLASAVSGFHPGFVDSAGGVINTFPLAHHGGTEAMNSSRSALMNEVRAKFSEHGGPVSAEEVRYANNTPIRYAAELGKYKIKIDARMFQRNTTPLFGAGLIDQVTGKQLEAIQRQQKKHPEISGHIATLKTGKYGRFGWRGNVPSLLEFCDQACAAEVGLETKRKQQPIDPTNKDYRNPSVDISDQQIRAMAAFVAALPAPHRVVPDDTKARLIVERGEQAFAAVGCAVCHTPSIGLAKGVYSDLLLHDMGGTSIDLNPADPYIARVTPVSFVGSEVVRQTRRVQYYGGTTPMTRISSMSNRRRTGSSKQLGVSGYEFRAPAKPSEKMRYVHQDTETIGTSETSTTTRNQRGTITTIDRTELISKNHGVQLDIEPTNFNQEWRTPPLWGVRDSAPYMHDGRAETLLESIAMHDGEAAGTRDRFLSLSLEDRQAIIAFLNTMVAPSNAPQPGT